MLSVCCGTGLELDAARIMDFKETVYPFVESDTLFLECVFVLLLVLERFFESRDV